MLQKFTGWQYLLIDAANQFGLDKMTFDNRIKWATDNLHMLEHYTDQAETKPLYIKAVMAIRKAQAGEPTGHLVGMDACCSGIQVMSALTSCISGATATGLVDPTVRADAYSKITDVMCGILGTTFGVSRSDAKQATMTSFYGSKAKPKEIFGENTPEINAFYQAAQQVAPGAWELLQDLLSAWNSYALSHQWKLPDGYDAVVKVMNKKEARIEVDELDHATFTYEFYENVGSKTGISLPANVVHSVDAYVLRCMHRRCNYNRSETEVACHLIACELDARSHYKGSLEPVNPSTKIGYYIEQFNRSGIADVVILHFITDVNVALLSTIHLQKLHTIICSMLVHNPFEVITVHDEFKCHANNMNHLRQHYIDIFAELAESNLLDDLLSQLHGQAGHFNKLSNNLGSLIRNSNYALS